MNKISSISIIYFVLIPEANMATEQISRKSANKAEESPYKFMNFICHPIFFSQMF